MSYDLVFWKQTCDCTDRPAHIHRLLVEGEIPDGLEEIPVDRLLDRVREIFPGIISVGGLEFWEGEDRGMFEVSRSQRHVHFCCRGLVASEMNRLIEIAHEFDCPLYDPQVDTRFSP
jgi:hypothetical protein